MKHLRDSLCPRRHQKSDLRARGGTSKGQFTKRTRSWSADGFHWKADSAHGKKVVRNCFPDRWGTTRRLLLPGSEHVGKSARNAADELVVEKCGGYRSMVTTGHCKAVDRPNLQYTTSVLMRTLETSQNLQGMQLMRLTNHINVVPELRGDFQYQDMLDDVCFEVDSDWAQCGRTRR